MVFTPPIFSKLKVNTLNLENHLSVLLGSYKIVDDLSKKSSLELLIIRTNKVIQSKTDRVTARDVFNQLVNELRQISTKDEEKMKQGTWFLLGALIHRYFRIIQEYETFNSRSFSFFNSNPTNCKLFQSIREALTFDTKLTENFKDVDLQILDVKTIVCALESFRDNMLLEVDNVPQYKKYPHFKKDSNFKKNLQDIIDKYSQIGSSTLEQFKGISFLGSLASELDSDVQQVDLILDECALSLAEKYKDFSELDNTTIENHFEKNIKSGLLKGKIIDLFYTKHMQENFKDLQHSSFILEMKKCYSSLATYSLIGGYVLLLKSKKIDKNMRIFLNRALGIEGNPELLTDQEMLYSIQFLKLFLEKNSDLQLDCKFFENKLALNTDISLTELKLVKKTQELKEEVVSTM